MLEKLEEQNGIYIYNLGTGTGYSVLMVNTFEKASQKSIPYIITKRSPRSVGNAMLIQQRQKGN